MISAPMSRRRRGVHEDLINDVGICQQPQNRSTLEEPNLWETIRNYETHESVMERHRLAKLECLRCPLLRPCEQMLSDFEKQGQPVDGVIAGRWSDCVVGSPRVGSLRQDTCRACGKKMRPQRPPTSLHPGSASDVQHVGEGLCSVCAPTFSKWAS